MVIPCLGVAIPDDTGIFRQFNSSVPTISHPISRDLFDLSLADLYSSYQTDAIDERHRWRLRYHFLRIWVWMVAPHQNVANRGVLSSKRIPESYYIPFELLDGHAQDQAFHTWQVPSNTNASRLPAQTSRSPISSGRFPSCIILDQRPDALKKIETRSYFCLRDCGMLWIRIVAWNPRCVS